MKNQRDDDRLEIVPPEAAPVIQSLRALGYLPESAIADIIDNSLDAGADKIKIDLQWNEMNSYIRIEDNGNGMSQRTLVEAMKLGSKNPLETRSAKDLGRFGLGLKTASFSLGKRLTVLTKSAEGTFVRCWDLDLIEDTQDWTLMKEPYFESLTHLGEIKGNTGTVVLIEKLDQLVPPPYTAHKKNKFYKQIDQLRQHLEMVFHRYMGGRQKGGVTFNLNENILTPWDPFLTKNLVTNENSKEVFSIKSQLMSAQAFILPHHSRLTKTEYEVAGGPAGWYDQQGFYIYRNKRLLVAGGWLGMYTKDEPSKLARIRVDIGNGADFDWKIDVKKSVARPPLEAINYLKKIAEKARDLSHKVYYTRNIGTSTVPTLSEHDGVDIVWEQATRKNKPFFLINMNNPLLKKLKEECSENANELLDVFIKHVQEYCPANQFALAPHLNSTEELVKVTPEHREELKRFYSIYRTMNFSLEDATIALAQVPMFSEYAKESIRNVLKEEEECSQL